MTNDVMRVAEANADDPLAASKLVAALGHGPFALVVAFVAPSDSMSELVRQLTDALYPAPVIGCTTAGEIGTDGYAEGTVVVTAFPAINFCAETILVPDLGDIDRQSLVGEVIRARRSLTHAEPDWIHDFAFLMVDGLSAREDALTAAIAPGLGSTPLFGGSAADGTRFLETFTFYQGKALRNAAVLTLVRTRCPLRVFKFDHFIPTAQRMVVTGADPTSRRVYSINAEPAAAEYARLLGKDPTQLTAFTFAAHPVVVRLGGQHHVRSIQQMDDNGDLIFFSAIDEGLVLTLAEPMDMETHLANEFSNLANQGAPSAILACDCILRRMEAQESQVTGRISSILKANNVAGFSTYGEQVNAMHVNQTLTGVAFYSPESAK